MTWRSAQFLTACLTHTRGALRRDSFQNVVELLDDMFQRAAAADEPPERNYVRKHALDMQVPPRRCSTAEEFIPVCRLMTSPIS